MSNFLHILFVSCMTTEVNSLGILLFELSLKNELENKALKFIKKQNDLESGVSFSCYRVFALNYVML